MKTNKVKQQTQAGSAGLIQRAMVPIRTLTFLILAGQILPPGMPSAQAAEILSQALGSEVAVVNADAPVQSDLSLAAKPTASKTSTDFLVVRTLSGTLSPSGGSDAYDPSRLTKLPGEPILRAGTVGDNASKINLIQNSTRKFSLDFKANQAGDAAFAFALFSSPADLSNGLTMAVGGSAGNKVTLEIRDWNYKLYSKEIELTGTMQNYTLQLTGSHLPAGFDGAQIREIVWVVKSTQTIQVETVDLKYEQTIAGGDYDGAALTELPRDLQYFSGAGDGNSAPNASADLKSIAPGVLKFDYVLPDPQDFAFSGVRFDSARPLGDKFVVALTGPQGKTAFLEIKDDAGKVHRVSLLMTGVRRNYVINLNRDTVYSAFQLDKIREIVFVADYSTGKSGSLQIETLAPGGAPVNGGAIEGSTYDASRLTTLPGSPTMGDGANNAYQLMNKISNREFSLDYRLKEPSDSSFALAWAQFATPQNLSAGVTFAAKGSVKGQVKVEFKDANGNILVRRISISEIDKLKNYNFSLTEGAFDASRVKEIVWVTDALAGMAGRIVVETGGSLVFPEHPDYSYAIDANKYSVTVKNNTSGRRYFYTTNTSYVIKSVWVPANGKVAAIEYVTDAGQTEFSFIHLESGGTLAKSNTSFALLYDANTYRTSVLDLLSRAVFDVGQCTAYGCIKADDVSPDGKTIVAQYSHSRTRQYETHFINMASGERLISGTQITGIKFLEDGNVTGVRPAGATLQLSPTDGSLLENVLVDLKNKKFVPQSYIFKGQTDALNYQNKFLLVRGLSVYHIFDAVNGLDKMSLVKSGVKFEGAPTVGQTPTDIAAFSAELTSKTGRIAVFGVSYTYVNGTKKTLKTMILDPRKSAPAVLDGTIRRVINTGSRIIYILSTGRIFTVTI
ncbi:MAG: hypothetical protein FGM27_06690 [Candidatus Omnitrophica bacterium]|nr:hypothetical protein [Candidatus Omnitrophota bacterium]